MKHGKIILTLFSILFVITLYFGVQASDAILGIRAIDMADTTLFGLMPLKYLGGLTISVVLTLYFLWGKKGYYTNELDNIVEELKKVVWPTKEETKVTTISVFVFTFIMVVVFVVFDLFWSNITLLIY